MTRRSPPFRPRQAQGSFFWAKRLIERPDAAGETGDRDVNVTEAAQVTAGAAETLRDRAWAWLHATFPERQVYIRSDGRVQFFTFGAPLQAAMAGLCLVFLGWVAFASVNVIFKDRIISAKNHRYQQMQATYETRIADLQVSYDELNGALLAAEDHFKSEADQLQRKQDTVRHLLSRNIAVDQTLSSIAGNATLKSDDELPRAAPDSDTGSDSLDVSVTPDSKSGDIAPIPGSRLNVMPQNMDPQPRTGRPVTKASFLDNALTRFASALFSFRVRRKAPQKTLDQPGLRILAQQTERIRRMSHEETSLLQGVDKGISARVDGLQTILARVGLSSRRIEREAGAMGGPDVPLRTVHIEGIADPAFTKSYEQIGAHANELNALFLALRHVPLTTPVHGSAYERTSSFGYRIDPFTHRASFHPGIDYAGPWGATVRATAAGVVDWAGPRGGYGNMVEIDHGYGFKTRYGHLSAVLVHVGSKVSKGSPVGKLGSTGRSTGPHVHYEVWSDNQLKNPRTYIEAGRHVLQ